MIEIEDAPPGMSKQELIDAAVADKAAKLKREKTRRRQAEANKDVKAPWPYD